MNKLLFFVIGLPTSWLVSQGVPLLPSLHTANLIDLLIDIAPRYQRLIVNFVFNFFELLISFVIVFVVALLLVIISREKFLESKFYYLLGNISSCLFILSFALIFIEYDKESITIFITKILFHLVGIVLAWFAVTQGVSKPNKLINQDK